MIVWLVGAALATEPICPDVDAELEIFERAAALANVDRAQEQAREVVRGFACGPPASVGDVARFFWAQAAVLVALGADDAADEALAAAARVAPGTRPEVYGKSLRDRYDRVATRPPTGVGSIDAYPVPKGHIAILDGDVRSLPVEVPIGPHVLQVGPRRGPASFADVVVVAPDVELVLETGLSSAPVRTGGRPLLTGLGIGIGFTGVVLLSTTFASRGAARRAYDEERFDAGDAWVGVNRATAVTGFLAAGLGGGLVVVGRW